MTKNQILLAIRENGCSIGYLQLLSLGLEDPKPCSQADKLLLQYMISEGYIRGKLCANGKLHLEPKGISYLDSLTQELKKEQDRTQDETQKNRTQIHHDWHITFFQAFISALTTVELWRILADIIQHLFP